MEKCIKRLLVIVTTLCFFVSTAQAVTLHSTSHATASNKKFIQLKLGMQKSEVIDTIGEPRILRGSITNKYGQTIEVWEYRVKMPNDDSAGQIIGKSIFTILTFGAGAATFRTHKEDYWLYFVDGKLVQWGQAGDWNDAQKQIYEVNFNQGPKL